MSKIQLGTLVHTSRLDVLSLVQQEIVNGGNNKPQQKPKPQQPKPNKKPIGWECSGSINTDGVGTVECSVGNK